MNISFTPRQPPLSYNCGVALEEADLMAAFKVADPDEDLFYDLFGAGRQPPLSNAEMLRRIARVVELAEQARALGLTAGSPEFK
jgi:hypothetical protein